MSFADEIISVNKHYSGNYCSLLRLYDAVQLKEVAVIYEKN
jgi:hypothetical protein